MLSAMILNHNKQSFLLFIFVPLFYILSIAADMHIHHIHWWQGYILSICYGLKATFILNFSDLKKSDNCLCEEYPTTHVLKKIKKSFSFTIFTKAFEKLLCFFSILRSFVFSATLLLCPREFYNHLQYKLFPVN